MAAGGAVPFVVPFDEHVSGEAQQRGRVGEGDVDAVPRTRPRDRPVIRVVLLTPWDPRPATRQRSYSRSMSHVKQPSALRHIRRPAPTPGARPPARPQTDLSTPTGEQDTHDQGSRPSRAAQARGSTGLHWSILHV